MLRGIQAIPMQDIRKKFVHVLLMVLFSFLLLEILCQVFFALIVGKSFEAQRNDPQHYYTTSEDPALRYVLKPGSRLEKDGRRIAINSFGIRDDSDSTLYPWKIAILGDSVPFGVRLSQEDSPSAALQKLTGDGIKVLNFGTPGYNLEEIQRFLELKYPLYKPQQIFYVLNLNDFSRRNTIYEGADNGLYRMYSRPLFKSPFFMRRAIYHYMKGGEASSVRWYRWLYEGNKRSGLPIIKKMADYARANHSEFTVILFPPGVAYENGNFVMQDVLDEISGYLKENGISTYVPVADFSKNTTKLQDSSDHLTRAGSEVIAATIKRSCAFGSRASDEFTVPLCRRFQRRCFASSRYISLCPSAEKCLSP